MVARTPSTVIIFPAGASGIGQSWCQTAAARPGRCLQGLVPIPTRCTHRATRSNHGRLRARGSSCRGRPGLPRSVRFFFASSCCFLVLHLWSQTRKACPLCSAGVVSREEHPGNMWKETRQIEAGSVPGVVLVLSTKYSGLVPEYFPIPRREDRFMSCCLVIAAVDLWPIPSLRSCTWGRSGHAARQISKVRLCLTPCKICCRASASVITSSSMMDGENGPQQEEAGGGLV